VILEDLMVEVNQAGQIEKPHREHDSNKADMSANLCADNEIISFPTIFLDCLTHHNLRLSSCIAVLRQKPVHPLVFTLGEIDLPLRSIEEVDPAVIGLLHARKCFFILQLASKSIMKHNS
jgi:hypothetical protein